MANFRKDPWATPAPELTIIESKTFDKIKRINKLAVCEHLQITKYPEDDVTIIFVYDGVTFGGSQLKDHAPAIFSRVVKFAQTKSQNKAGQLFFLPWHATEDADTNFEVLLDRIDNIFDEVEEKNRDARVIIINASRQALYYITPPESYGDIEALRVVNRVEHFKFDTGYYPAIMTAPDKDVLKRNDFGKIGKENQTIIGEWVHATVAALDGNRYDINTDNYTYEILTEKTWDAFVDALWAAKFVSIDTETDNLNRIVNKMACAQFSLDGKHAYIVPFDHPECNLSNTFRNKIIDDLAEYFERGESKYHIYANAKFDLIRLTRELELKWYNHDFVDVSYGAQCFHRDTKVLTEKGLVPITDLALGQRVWSWNHKNSKYELKRILNIFKHKNKKKMVKIKHEKGELKVTCDHPIWSITRNQYIPAGELTAKDKILLPPQLLDES